MKETLLTVVGIIAAGVFIVLFSAYLPWVFAWGKSIWEGANRWDCEGHGGVMVATSTPWGTAVYNCHI